MSIILKGIDMPTNGETLVVGIYGDGNVSIEYSKPLVLAIEPNAEAIQIPKDHGILIEEHYPGELQAKCPEGLFIMYHSADDDTNRFMFETEAEQ